jgi:arsenate reductase-like glutaredoxin family protein
MKKYFLILLFAGTIVCVQAQSQSQLEQDLAELRAWMRKKSVQADSVTRAEWPTVKQEFKQLTAKLDNNTSKLSDKSKEEYKAYKDNYTEWEERNELRQSVNLDGRELERWENAMTGTTRISAIKSENMRNAFIRLIDYTREHRRNWTLRDWDYAEFVFGEMNTRKSEVLDNLNNSDKIKIAALQVEFATLKKGREAQEMYKDMREKR